MRLGITAGVFAALAFSGCDNTTTPKPKSAFAVPESTSGPNGSFGNANGPKNNGNTASPRAPPALMKPTGAICGPTTGNNLGLYTWGHEVWQEQESPLIDFILQPKGSGYGCGDVYINVSDYSAPDWIPNPESLYPFMHNVRVTGNRAIIYLVYGDVDVGKNGAPDGPRVFAETFFGWVSTLTDSELSYILPIGVSYDCEHLSPQTITDALTRAQDLKESIRASRLGGDASRITIQWTIEGEKKPVDTDIVMRLADSALMMGYRNHVGTSINDPTGVDNIITRLMDYMFGEQCTHCLDDKYASDNYKAKIKLMFEADCQCGASCKKISFCAYDASTPGWGDSYENGAEYMMATLSAAESELRLRLGGQTFDRLFGRVDNMSLFVIHNWQWFTCFFNDPALAVTTPIGKQLESCAHYANFARSCRSM